MNSVVTEKHNTLPLLVRFMQKSEICIYPYRSSKTGSGVNNLCLLKRLRRLRK